MTEQAIKELESRLESGAKTFTEHSIRIEHLHQWQRTQNGSLKEMCSEMKSLKSWLMTLLGGMVVSLVLLVLNLVGGVRI